MKFRTVLTVSFHSMRRQGKGVSGTGNAIAQGQKRIYKVHILKEYTGHFGAQFHIGEVPKALDTQVD